jgi:two-component system chemotaxis response regulator CheY
MAQILAVDDSKSIRKLVSLTLSTAGHNVTVAEDGEHCMDVLGETGFDLIITDIHMPAMDGIELIKNIRNVRSHRFTPILVLTTESSEDMKQQGKAAGATGWIVKPFTPDSFLSVVQRVLNT